MILVTGVSGFVGSSAVKHLANRGYTVSGLLRSTSSLRLLSGLRIPLRYADLGDRDSLLRALDGCGFVVHCAARSLDWGTKKDFVATNVDGVRNIVHAACEVGVKGIVHISTTNVEGFGRRNISEDASDHRELHFLYSRTKLEGENVARELCEKHGINLIVLRPSAIYGHDDWKWTYAMVDRIATGYWPMVGKGRAVFTPLFIENFCSALQLAIEKVSLGGVYNITDNRTISWFEFCKKIAAALGRNLRYRNIPFPVALSVVLFSELCHGIVRPGLNPRFTLYRLLRVSKDFHYSCAEAQEKLGYKPDSDITAHIQKTVQWYIKTKTETDNIIRSW